MEAATIYTVSQNNNHDTKKKSTHEEDELERVYHEKEPPPRAHFDYNIPLNPRHNAHRISSRCMYIHRVERIGKKMLTSRSHIKRVICSTASTFDYLNPACTNHTRDRHKRINNMNSFAAVSYKHIDEVPMDSARKKNCSKKK